MAQNKLKHRSLAEKDGAPYLTTPNSQLDLERRLENDNETGAGPVTTVNPNPLGADEYVGTDPIYQNSSTVHAKPFAAEEGGDQLAEEQLKADYNLSGVSDERKADDFGFGGKAEKVGDAGGDTFRTILPGQEGYDLAKAEEQNGPPLRVYADDQPSSSTDDDDDDDDDDEEEKGSPTNPDPAQSPSPAPQAPPGA